jgi:hypothetical protein
MMHASHDACFEQTNAGVPDGIVSYQTPRFWDILEGLWMENFDVLYDHLVCFAINFWAT